jgi:hypothetical protein
VKAGPASIALLVSLAGCGTIQQKVTPIALSGSQPREICVVENPSARVSFLDAYKDALAKRNLTVRMLPPGTAVGACPLTTTYAATWRWDLALYLSYANLKVYRNSHLEGEALYDAEQAKADTKKFIHADVKIQELTDQLFPG